MGQTRQKWWRPFRLALRAQADDCDDFAHGKAVKREVRPQFTFLFLLPAIFNSISTWAPHGPRRLSLSMKICAQREALRHQSLAFCARLYAKPCEKRSA